MIGIKKKRKLIRSVLIYGICIFEDGFHAEKVKESLYKGYLYKGICSFEDGIGVARRRP